MYTCTYGHVQVCMRTYVCAHVRGHVHADVHVYMHVHVHAHAHVQIHVQVHVHIPVRACVIAPTYVRTSGGVYVRAYLCMCTWV